MGLIVVLLGGVVGVLLALASLALLALTARAPSPFVAGRAADPNLRARRERTALTLAIVSLVPSAMFWRVVLAGAGTRGEALDLLGGDFVLLVPVLVESIALVWAIARIVRRRRAAR